MKNKENNKFWIIWQPFSTFPPRVRFNKKAEAIDVAQKMAQRHKIEFYVMQASAHLTVQQTPIKLELIK